MGKIIKLNKTLANQIAAGEVVERPVSVVKELVENSIDAGASNIKVEILEGGIKEIIVSDNGSGIEYDDLKIVFDKYTTSKIKSIEDLYNIMTFGFRGEALSSISSVSKTTIISKTKDSLVAYKIESIGGENGNITETFGETGTKIIVKDLFYNTPARLNYLKKPKTEYLKIKEFLEQISLAYPNIAFEFVSDKKIIFKFGEHDSLKSRIYNIFGDDFASNLLEINFGMPGMKVEGFISDPKISFKNKSRQIIFVNKRIIKSALISKAIADAYNRFIPHQNNPGYVLNLTIDPTTIDVNVHPRKLEIRFAQENQVFRVFYHAIEEKLNNVSLVSSKDLFEDNKKIEEKNFDLKNNIGNSNLNNFSENNGKKEKFYIGSGTKFKSYSPYKEINFNPKQSKISDSINFTKEFLAPLAPFEGGNENSSYSNKEKKEDLFLEQSTDLHDTPLGKIIGQAHNSYIIVETNSGIQILDQHALAERIIYEKLIKNDKQKNINSQGLLIGETIKLTAKEEEILKNYIDIFNEMGFEIEFLQDSLISINAIPDFIKKENLKAIFTGIIEDIGEQGFSKSKTLQEVKNKIFAYTACRSAIKFGNKLNLFEMNKLLNDAILTYSSTCPHGRPVVYEISLSELKGKYER